MNNCVLGDALGYLFDFPGNLMDVPGILVRALLERGLSSYEEHRSVHFQSRT